MLKEHIKNDHKDHLKRAYSREALEFVLKDPKYVDWLNKTTSVTEGRNYNDSDPRIKQITCRKVEF